MQLSLYDELQEKEEREEKELKQYVFPVLLILLDIGTGIVYAAGGDIRKTVYWIAAAVLIVAVTF